MYFLIKLKNNMSNKFKPWKQRQPKRRDLNAREMFLDSRGGPSRERRSRRNDDEQEDPRFYERNNRYFGNLDDIDDER